MKHGREINYTRELLFLGSDQMNQLWTLWVDNHFRVPLSHPPQSFNCRQVPAIDILRHPEEFYEVDLSSSKIRVFSLVTGGLKNPMAHMHSQDHRMATIFLYNNNNASGWVKCSFPFVSLSLALFFMIYSFSLNKFGFLECLFIIAAIISFS